MFLTPKNGPPERIQSVCLLLFLSRLIFKQAVLDQRAPPCMRILTGKAPKESTELDSSVTHIRSLASRARCHQLIDRIHATPERRASKRREAFSSSAQPAVGACLVPSLPGASALQGAPTEPPPPSPSRHLNDGAIVVMLVLMIKHTERTRRVKVPWNRLAPLLSSTRLPSPEQPASTASQPPSQPAASRRPSWHGFTSGC